MFDFLSGNPRYSAKSISRMNARKIFLVDPFCNEINGARVLDLGAHDGRWSYAFARAGASQVVAVEERLENIHSFCDLPKDEYSKKIKIIKGDIFDRLEDFVAAGDKFDVVAAFGILYHIMDHFRLFLLIKKLNPSLILIDGEFIQADAPLIQLIRERTDKLVNAVASYDGQDATMVGVLSTGAISSMAEVLGYNIQWIDWSSLPEENRVGAMDYYRYTRKRRCSCFLKPRSDFVRVY